MRKYPELLLIKQCVWFKEGGGKTRSIQKRKERKRDRSRELRRKQNAMIKINPHVITIMNVYIRNSNLKAPAKPSNNCTYTLYRIHLKHKETKVEHYFFKKGESYTGMIRRKHMTQPCPPNTVIGMLKATCWIGPSSDRSCLDLNSVATEMVWPCLFRENLQGKKKSCGICHILKCWGLYL